MIILCVHVCSGLYEFQAQTGLVRWKLSTVRSVCMRGMLSTTPSYGWTYLRLISRSYEFLVLDRYLDVIPQKNRWYVRWLASMRGSTATNRELAGPWTYVNHCIDLECQPAHMSCHSVDLERVCSESNECFSYRQALCSPC